jgi:hypothetical protein
MTFGDVFVAVFGCSAIEAGRMFRKHFERSCSRATGLAFSTSIANNSHAQREKDADGVGRVQLSENFRRAVRPPTGGEQDLAQLKTR